MAFNAGAVIGKVILDTRSWLSGVDEIESSGKKTTEAFNKIKNSALIVSGIISTGFAASAKAALDFEKEMANVSTLVDTAVVDVNGMSRELLQLDSRLGSATDLTGGLYQALSASVDPAQAVKFVGEAAQFAKAALIDTNTAVDVITTGLNAYGLEADKAAGISDKLFSVIKLGKTTGEELSAVIGQSIPLAANMGITFDELGASVAIMTRQGIKAAEATTQFNAVINSFLKPSDEMAETIKILGFESASAAIEQLGLKETMEAVIGTTDGSNEAMSELFQNTRALRGAMALTGQGAAAFDDVLKEITNSAGATNEAFEKQELTFDTLKTSVNKMAIQVGQILLPTILDIVEGVSGWFEKLNELDESTKRNIVGVGLFVAAIGPGLAIIQKLIAGYKIMLPLMLAAKAGFAGQAIGAGASTAATIAHTAAVKLAAIAQGAWNLVLSANPLVLAGVGIAALTATIIGLATSTRNAALEMEEAGTKAERTQEQMNDLAAVVLETDESFNTFYNTLMQGASIIDTSFDPNNIQKTITNINKEVEAIDEETKKIKQQIELVKKRGKQRIFQSAEQDKNDAKELSRLNEELNNRIKARENLVKDLAKAEALKDRQAAVAAEAEKKRLDEIAEKKKKQQEEDDRRREIAAAKEERERERSEAAAAEVARQEEFLQTRKYQRIAALNKTIEANRQSMLDAEKARQEELRQEYEKTASSLISTFGPVLSDLGAALAGAEDGWEAVKKSALNAIAGIVEGFAEQWALQSVAAFIAGNIPQGIGFAAASTAGFIGAGAIRALKDGGIADGPTLVGEEGPELINVGTPSRVFPADETARMIGGDIKLNITNIINDDMDIEKVNRRLGRTIQRVTRRVS